MQAYVGDTRSRKLLALLANEGIGSCVIRGRIDRSPRLTPWFYDNGAYEDWKAQRPFDAAAFEHDVPLCQASAPPPRFAVIPDLVAQGRTSLDFSSAWRKKLPDDLQWYLALQDGMEGPDVCQFVVDHRVAGIFVGGTLPWKLRTAERWVRLAHDLGLKAHIGRVGTGRRIAWARDIGADSIDSSLPLWSAENAAVFLRTLRQQGLFRPC